MIVSCSLRKARLFAPLFIVLCCFVEVPEVSAMLKVASVIGSNMVLQRNSEARIWGWGEKGGKVTVKAEWQTAESSVIVGADGTWQARLLTGNAGGPYKLVVYDQKDTLRFENIMLGEVWVCSGQSNMEFSINMLGGWNKLFKQERDELLKTKFTGIRLFTVQKDTSYTLKQDCKGEWQMADTDNVARFSATAWFFGVELSKKLGVPVGLIVSSWGGTPAEAWTPRQVIDSDPDLQFYRSDPNKNSWFPTYPGILYNSMIYPLLKTNIRGVIWYQGESNVTDAETYRNLFPAMIGAWRHSWGLGNFPFYYVQIAPFTYDRAVVGAMLREAQMQSLSTPNTGMAVTMDITGDVTDIHPKDKPDVGKRLALWALADTYGFDKIESSGPLYKSFQVEGKNIRIEFDHANDGLVLRNKTKELNGFMIAGSDRHFLPAKAQVEGNMLILKADRVKEPVAARYAFTNTSAAVLFNGAGLPASSFRTDSWPIVTDIVMMRPVFDEKSSTIQYELLSDNSKASIHYTTDGTEPTCNSSLYSEKKISMINPGLIQARACVDGIASETIGSWEIRQHKGMAAKVTYVNAFAKRYSAGGLYGLVDGAEGSVAFNDGTWQGFEGDDLDITVDLGQLTMIRKVTVHFLSDTNSWIFLPRHVEIKTSMNGVNYDTGSRYDNIGALSKSRVEVGKQIVTLRAPFMKNARYIRVKANNIGVCPPGHPGAGDKAWLFIDEIIVE
jgi:sialate O-acetylesterase